MEDVIAWVLMALAAIGLLGSLSAWAFTIKDWLDTGRPPYWQKYGRWVRGCVVLFVVGAALGLIAREVNPSLFDDPTGVVSTARAPKAATESANASTTLAPVDDVETTVAEGEFRTIEAPREVVGRVELQRDTSGRTFLSGTIDRDYLEFELDTPDSVVYLIEGEDQREPTDIEVGPLEDGLRLGQGGDFSFIVSEGTRVGRDWTVLIWDQSLATALVNATLHPTTS